MLAEFILSVLRALPSSSSTSPKHPTPASIFGDHLVDMIWAVDLELDELLNEARLSVAEAADWKVLSKDVANVLNKAKRAQANAESDKQRIPSIVMKLLVRRHRQYLQPRFHMCAFSGIWHHQPKPLSRKTGVNCFGQCGPHSRQNYAG